jgi:myo-inositol catabolism protein IolH
MEKCGMRMDFQAHPFDFYENSNSTADIIRSYESPSLGYLYSISHTFHYDGGKGDIADILIYAGNVLKHIIVASAYGARRHRRLFYIPLPKGQTG